MDLGLDSTPASTPLIQCCDCDCICSTTNPSYSNMYLRSVKRKFDEFEETSCTNVARVEIGNECVLLREMVSTQQETIQDLSVELEEERNAASSAANEAMSMILRLQREKAEIQMEARQFKRFSEEKMAHDEYEVLALEDFLYKREQVLQSLNCEVGAYKHRLMSYGLTENEAEGGERSGMIRNTSVVENLDGQFDYPPLKCNLNENRVYSETENGKLDVEGDTPSFLKELESRINQLEQSPRQIQPDVETVLISQSPTQPRHFRRFSNDSSSSIFAMMVKETGSDVDIDSPTKLGASIKNVEYTQTEDYSNLKNVDDTSDGGDDTSDRVYTIDAVHNRVNYDVVEPKAYGGMDYDYFNTTRESPNFAEVEDPDITKLYMRIQALEADRESMKQAIISMRTDKAQLVLLKEIAQHLCKEVTPARRMPLQKPSLIGSFSVVSIFKWIMSFVLWRKKACQRKYVFGLSTHNVGLLMLLDKGTRARQWRCLSSTQV